MKEWDTELLADPSFFRTMVTVRLPDGLIPADGPQPNIVDGKPEYDFSHGGYIGGILRREYKIEVSEERCVILQVLVVRALLLSLFAGDVEGHSGKALC